MPHFMLMYRGDRNGTSTQAADAYYALLDRWTAWYGKNEAFVTELGAPLTIGGHLPEDGDVSDVLAYSIVNAPDAAEVKRLLADHPHMTGIGNSIDILEVTPISPPGSL
jgi:hypothetical protein